MGRNRVLQWISGVGIRIFRIHSTGVIAGGGDMGGQAISSNGGQRRTDEAYWVRLDAGANVCLVIDVGPWMSLAMVAIMMVVVLVARDIPLRVHLWMARAGKGMTEGLVGLVDVI
jgi:hypothetical protein